MQRLRRRLPRRHALAAGVALVIVAAPGVLANAHVAVDRPAVARIAARRVDPPDPPPVPTDQLGAYRVAELVNAERARRGLAPVGWHDRVAAAAQAHSNDMVAMGSMQYDGSDGSNAGTRLARAGFQWTTWAENVAAGFVDADSVFAGWMRSTGHRQAMLGRYAFIGVAAAVDGRGIPYWTLVVASGS